MLGVDLPPDPKRAKGFVGQLAERALGGQVNSRAAPDFEALGIELKTLPIDERGRVCESTFVCTAPVAAAMDATWETSRVRAKLCRVLFLIVERRPPRRFGAAWLWSPSEEQERVLRADWEELMGQIGAGAIEEVDARSGRWLQLRPKGANARARVRAFDADGAPFWAPTKGFYLRSELTRALLEEAGFG